MLTPRFSGSGRWPWGRGGVLSLENMEAFSINEWLNWQQILSYCSSRWSTYVFCLIYVMKESRTFEWIVVVYLGSCWPVLPLPYRGMTLSRLMPALQTGHTCLFGLVSNHCNRKTCMLLLLKIAHKHNADMGMQIKIFSGEEFIFIYLM